MNVLALNCGSSSVKFGLMTLDGGAEDREKRPLLVGAIERIGRAATVSVEIPEHLAFSERAAVPDHEAAVRRVIGAVTAEGQAVSGWAGARIDAVGHRVVHGGERFTQPEVISDDVLEAIAALEELAPLHNRPSLAGIHACRKVLSAEVPMVAVFDTAFHSTLPEHAYRYAIPYELAVRHGVRRYGFHGTALRSVLSRYCELTGIREEQATFVALHLGNGCSAAAIERGRSVDTSMGLTPLEGLVMGTRSGDLDPAIIGYLARKEGVPSSAVETWLYERSGLHGVSGTSHDMRDLLEQQEREPRARLAVEIFCYRARKYLGAYLAALGGAQAVVFSGGIGETRRRGARADLRWNGMVWSRPR